ncbi:cyclic lactone autoinducer peptide [Savagea sp. SN6]|uniref:Cyclic lactone autoinducer peptide n=1 Tax=Savagea serpentis TaxID=2785297 RepID=A0A8J7G3X8_9BACL|nr:cyclic lactone autoinducer peptide [Savagea serpentis]MBF4501805.1 cyclic lactone autoinducer peptide [Savagea serpentis]
MIKVIGKLLIFWGSLGSRQMCFSIFHEIEIPEELKTTTF